MHNFDKFSQFIPVLLNWSPMFLAKYCFGRPTFLFYMGFQLKSCVCNLGGSISECPTGESPTLFSYLIQFALALYFSTGDRLIFYLSPLIRRMLPRYDLYGLVAQLSKLKQGSHFCFSSFSSAV